MRKTIKQLQGESDYWRVKFINEQQRAEAAEAKLVPVGWEVCSPEWIERNGPCSCGEAPRIAFGDIGPHYHPKSFTRPATAASLAELVPEEPTRDMLASVEWRSEHKDGLECYRTENIKRIWRLMRPELMRNIEGVINEN